MQWNMTQPLKKNEIMPFEATWMAGDFVGEWIHVYV